MTGLAEMKRSATVEHITQAALRGLTEHGLDVTVDEIATIAGVSRRTVFRHFTTRDELVVAAIRATRPLFDESLPLRDGADWREWLSELYLAVHRANVRFGRLVWELLARPNLSEPLATVAAEITRYRAARNEAIVRDLWQALGRDDAVPPVLRAGVIAHFSPHFTIAVHRDAGGDAAMAASLATASVLALVDSLEPDESRSG
ncbi:TetR/AcrR family transcriptional regulator [Streptomyces sp. NPDC004539]|uniref:TetR/AcrR family transcriptional regulator n=1 Tax=Streptomyces sp. NPDC004539 TaxID=3154280 RepID=UPI0033B4721D